MAGSKAVADCAQALSEVLDDFHHRYAQDKQLTVRHGYLMARVHGGFHCWAVYAQKDPGSKTKLVFFDSANFQDALDAAWHLHSQAARRDPLNRKRYETVFMLPLMHVEPDTLATDSHYYGIITR